MDPDESVKELGRRFKQNRKRHKLTAAEMGEALKTVKIVDKEEAFWMEVKRQADTVHEEHVKGLKINKALSEIAQSRIDQIKAQQPADDINKLDL